MTRILTGKVALVTGGSRGIGAAIATALADAGADIAFSYHASSAKAEALVMKLRAKGVRCTAFQADHANCTATEKLVHMVFEQFGALDILVNNAGVFATGTVDDPDNDLDVFDRQHMINFQSPVNAIRAAVQLMGEGGRIISISSGIATRIGAPGMADYAASKAALVAYTKGVARDLGLRNITANIIECGSINTDMNPQDGASADAQRGLSAMGRYGSVQEIAAGAVFLASPAASFITGTTLSIDGGVGA